MDEDEDNLQRAMEWEQSLLGAQELLQNPTEQSGLAHDAEPRTKDTNGNVSGQMGRARRTDEGTAAMIRHTAETKAALQDRAHQDSETDACRTSLETAVAS